MCFDKRVYVLLSSGLYRWSWNLTRSAAKQVEDYTSSREFHPAPKTSLILRIVKTYYHKVNRVIVIPPLIFIITHMSFISVRNLKFSYDEKQQLLDDVSFDINKGDYVAIVGRNGSGKSTLAKLLMGLESADGGSITIDGLELNDENIKKIRARMGIVFQNPDNQFIGATVRDDIAFGLENRCVSHEDMQILVDRFAVKVGLENLLDKEPEALSGGQKQRVALAGVLAMQSDIIILDEATSMLDPRGRDTIKNLVRELHKDKSLTIISITHDIEEAYKADDCILLCDGRVCDHNKGKEVFKDAKGIRAIGLDVPFVGKVKEAFKEKGIFLEGDSEEEIVGELWQYTLKN